LADGESVLRRPLIDADDARRMVAALVQLGADIREDADGTMRVRGVGGRWKPTADGAGGVTLNLNNAGTATRFLAAAALLSPIPVTIDGNERMRRRPIGELGGALEQMGAAVEYAQERGFPPMRITAARDGKAGGATVTLPTTQSSQFISAILLAGPSLPGGVTVKLTGEVTSASYISMTLGLLQKLGATVRSSGDLRVMRVTAGAVGDARGRGVPAFDLAIEPDASGATYFWGAAALVPHARARVLDLGDDSLQGDSDFPDLLATMGATVTKAAGASAWIQVRGAARIAPIMADLSNMPDAAMTLAAVASFAEGTSVVRGLRTLRVKETDRIAAMQHELGKIGVEVRTPVGDDEGAITITPPVGGVDCSAGCLRVEFETYDDHRMAMSLALIGLRRPNVWIKDPACVAKTYATFWRDFAGIYGRREP
jgi:3-phosphoshikimate 1-carboxyvinyltransferase